MRKHDYGIHRRGLRRQGIAGRHAAVRGAKEYAVAYVAAVGENRAGGYCKISGGHADDRT